MASLKASDGPLQVSPAVPDLKIGSIQLLGAMVVDTAEQFEAAMRDDSAIERALRDTRYGRALRRQRDGPARRWVHCWRVRSRAGGEPCTTRLI